VLLVTGSKAAQWVIRNAGPEVRLSRRHSIDNGFIVTRGAYQTGFQGGRVRDNRCRSHEIHIDWYPELYGNLLVQRQ